MLFSSFDSLTFIDFLNLLPFHLGHAELEASWDHCHPKHHAPNIKRVQLVVLVL